MALLKQCFCYSLRQGSFVIGSYSLVVYCVAFAVELWWIVESLLILPAPAYTLCALYFFDFIMAAILLFGLLVRQRKYLMSWTLMTVLSFFPEAGMVLFMSLYYWPAHKFEYGVIELVYWSLRAIFNIFGAVCVCSLYLTWRDEELILGRLHDLTLANVETGSSVGIGVLRNSNFGTLKGNNLAYQNYAYVDSSAGVPDNLSYKNSNGFHSSKRLRGRNSFKHKKVIAQGRHHHNQNEPVDRNNRYFKYIVYNKKQFCNECQNILSKKRFNTKNNLITSLPVLCNSIASCSISSGFTCLIALQRQQQGKEKKCQRHPRCFPYCSYMQCSGGGKSCINNQLNIKKDYLSLAKDNLVGGKGIASSCSTIYYNKNILSLGSTSQPGSLTYGNNSPNNSFHITCASSTPHQKNQHLPQKFAQEHVTHQRLSNPTVLQTTFQQFSQQQTDRNTKIPIASKTRPKDTTTIATSNKRQPTVTDTSSSGDGVEDQEQLVPQIEIVICTEVHGSIETKVIKQSPPTNHHNYRINSTLKKDFKRVYLHRNHFVPLRYFRRAVSDCPNIVIMDADTQNDSRSDGEESSFNSMLADNGSVSSTRSMITDGNKSPMSKKSKGAGGYGCGKRRSFTRKGNHKGDGERGSGGGGGHSGRACRVFGYIYHIVRCCVSRSSTSLFSDSDSADGGGCRALEGSNNSGGGYYGRARFGSPRGLFNTRSFTMNSDVQGTMRSHPSIAMKSEFNPAMLFDPGYRKSRISELGIAGIGLEPPGQIPIGPYNNRMNRSRSLWNVSNEEYWNRPPPSRPVSMGYVNHIHQLEQFGGHKDCCTSHSNSITTLNNNRRHWVDTGRRAQSIDALDQFYRNPISRHHKIHSCSSIEPPDEILNYQDIAL